MRLTRALAVSLVGIATLSSSLPAQAQNQACELSGWPEGPCINQFVNGPWMMFSFNSVGVPVQGCQPADPDGAACTLPAGVDAVPAPALPVNFDGVYYYTFGWFLDAGPDGVTMTVTDVGAPGEIFEVYDSWTSDPSWLEQIHPMVTTSDATGGDCGTSPVDCISAGASHGTVFFEQGWHFPIIVVKAAPNGPGTGFVRFDGDTRGWYWDSDGDGMNDIGDMCPDSDMSPTIVIGTCDTGVENVLYGDGCMMADLLKKCAAEADHGNRMKCTMDTLYNAAMKGHGLSTVWGLPENQGKITSCIANY